VTIQRAGDQAGGRGLAHPASAGEEIGMMQAIMRNCILQRARQDFLARDIFKFLRAPLAGDYLVGH